MRRFKNNKKLNQHKEKFKIKSPIHSRTRQQQQQKGPPKNSNKLLNYFLVFCSLSYNLQQQKNTKNTFLV